MNFETTPQGDMSEREPQIIRGTEQRDICLELEHRALGHRPDDQKLAVGINTGDLVNFVTTPWGTMGKREPQTILKTASAAFTSS